MAFASIFDLHHCLESERNIRVQRSMCFRIECNSQLSRELSCREHGQVSHLSYLSSQSFGLQHIMMSLYGHPLCCLAWFYIETEILILQDNQTSSRKER